LRMVVLISVYVLRTPSDISELKPFVLARLARRGMCINSTRDMRVWETVFERVLVFKTFMNEVAERSRKGRVFELLDAETYMCTPREVFPDSSSR
jgi:hypothetical protein